MVDMDAEICLTERWFVLSKRPNLKEVAMYGKYRVIRTSDDYQLAVIHCSLEGLDEYYLYEPQPTGSQSEIPESVGWSDDDFEKVKKTQADDYLARYADATGFGDVAKEPMDSLYEVWVWIRSKQTRTAQQRKIERANAHQRDRLELLDSLMRTGPAPTKEEFRELLAENGDPAEWPEFEKRYGRLFRPSKPEKNVMQDAT